ncbi:MAG TPA: PQQ-dependent sugar dehydrogenase [Gemmatimonadales bacterium]|nr:PQQ-dependent sugar dehydrogenase [Gemmatimonadales bacterium]
MRFFSLAALTLGAALVGCADGQGPAADVPLALAPVDSGYDFATMVAAPPGDTARLFVVERGGRVWLRKHDARPAAPVLDFSPEVGEGVDGLLGIAFHPQYAANRRLFLYVVGADAQGRILEYRATADGDGIEPAPVRTVITIPYTRGSFHNGGTLAFGPDGKLYLATGDNGDEKGAPPLTAQDSTNLLGKMLRLDVDAGAPYVVPQDNPFAGRAGWRGEIWLLGMRNPFRWSFDAPTKELWLGDVGEDDVEEVDRIRDGQRARNLGWPVMEGDRCMDGSATCDPTAALARPVATYTHAEGCSVVGGVVYRGRAMPELRGTYFYSDFCKGWIRRLRATKTGAEPAGAEIPAPLVAGRNDNAVGFGTDGRGEVYVVYASGRVYRIVGGK